MNDYIKKHLLSSAYLKALHDEEKKILLDLYLPLLIEFFRKRNIGIIKEDKIDELSLQLEEEFGLKISTHALTSLLNRAKKKGILQRQENMYKVKDLDKFKFKLDFKEAENTVIKLIDILENNIKKQFPGKEISRETIENTLWDYLGQFDYQLIMESPTMESKKLRKNENLFILGNVICRLYQENQEFVELFQNVIVGHFLSRLIFYDPNFLQAKYENLNIYLDTRIILRLVGGEGETLKKIYEKFIFDLINQNVKLFIFQHTYDEVTGILEGCYNWIDNEGYDPSKASLALRYFKEKGYRQSDIELLKNNLPNELEKLNIKIVDSPDIILKYQIDENKLKNVIIEVYSANPYFEPVEKEYTIEKDIKSISSIYQLRKGSKPINLKQTKHLFITSNIGLAYAALKFHKEEFKEAGFSIPACVTDIFLGTMSWINNPDKIKIYSPLWIIPLSISIIRPSKDFLEKWHNEIKKLLNQGQIDETTFILLRDSSLSRELLEEKTMGDPDQITPKTPIEILEEIKREAYKKYEEEKKAHEETKLHKEILEKKEQERERKRQERAKKWANYTYWVIVFLIAIVSYVCSTSIIRKNTLISLGVSAIITILNFLGEKRIKNWFCKKFESLFKYFGAE